MIGIYIKNRRQELNISQKQLSENLNISIQRLNNFENESRIPSLTMLGDLSKYLNFDINNIKHQNTNQFIFDYSLFPQNITKYRKKERLSQIDLSKKINVSRQTISKWEKNESYPNIDLFYEVCDILKIKPSSLVCKKISTEKKTKYYITILLSIIFIFILLIFIIKNLNQSNENISPSSNKTSISSSIENSSTILTTSQEISYEQKNNNLISESTINLINKSYNYYRELMYDNNIEHNYTIFFNDSNLSDIKFYTNESIILPFYFDNEKYIDHYLLNDIELSGFTILSYTSDITLTPVYIYYDDYLNNISVQPSNTNNMRYTITSIKSDYHFFIVPNYFQYFSTFEIKSIDENYTIFISSSNYLTFNGNLMSYMPQIMFFDFVQSEFINQINKFDYIEFVAFNQKDNNLYSSDFIKVNEINFLYINSNNSYNNFLNITSNVNYLILDNKALEYEKFVIGSIKNIKKNLKTRHVKKRLMVY